jgi:hypothetical protein
LSNATTSQPGQLPASATAMFAPMNPAPPVISTRIRRDYAELTKRGQIALA